MCIDDKMQKSGIYRLQGLVNHRGATDGGHYWALVRDMHSWFSIDDAVVSKRSYQKVEDDL